METIEFESPTVNAKGEVIARTKCSAEQFTEDLGKGISLELIVIPAGSFQMGSLRNIGNADEQPQHFVTIKSFMLGKYLITQRQWKAVVGKLPPCRFKGDNLPVERVSWDEAQKFCQRLSKQTRRNYYLPSETQWEYACRSGTTTPFSFGETLTSDIANYNGEHIFKDEPRGSYFHSTSEGGKYPPNAFGVYDMHGNLMEWCADNWLWMIIQPPHEMEAPTKCKTIPTALHAADRGTIHPNFVAVWRGFGLRNLMLKSMLGFGWFARWNKTMKLYILKDSE